MKSALTVATLLAGTSFSVAQEDAAAQAAACSTVEDSLQRLTCFDNAFPATPADELAANGDEADESEAVSPWSIEVSTSPLDDSPKIIAQLRPVDGSSSLFGGVVLGLRCMENTTDVVVATDQLFIMQDSVKVTTRIGDDPATTAQWQVATDGKTVGLWTGAQAIPFIKSLPDNSRLVVRVEGNRRTDAEFDLGNVSEVAGQISEACNWPDAA